MFGSTQSREVSGKNTTNRYFSKQIILFRFYSKKRKQKESNERLSKEIVHCKKRKEERLVLKCFMQIKITEYTKVVHVYSIPGAHQTKPFLVSAAVCSHFSPSFHRSLLGKPFFFFPSSFLDQLFSSTQPQSIVHANKLSSLKQSLQQVMGAKIDRTPFNVGHQGFSIFSACVVWISQA